MGEFFKGWRQKLGIGSLGLACVFVMGWIRGDFVEDTLTLGVQYREHTLVFGEPGVIWWAMNTYPARTSFKWTTSDSEWRMVGIAAANPYSTDGPLPELDLRIWKVPYCSMVLPLALLSACLLLSKPRNSVSSKTAEHVSTAGA